MVVFFTVRGSFANVSICYYYSYNRQRLTVFKIAAFIQTLFIRKSFILFIPHLTAVRVHEVWKKNVELRNHVRAIGKSQSDICKAPAKRSQYCWRNMLCAFEHSGATCCNVLGVVGSNLKMVKFSCHSCGCCMMLWSFGQVRATIIVPGHAH